MRVMTMPSIALPTGPYDWHNSDVPLATFDKRLARFRAVMTARGVTHAVVHGNTFDHAALHWLTHFTPKLGPAYALVPADGPLRILFAGGPGMKPSAERLTWVTDVVAVKSAGADVKRWIGEDQSGGPISLGLVEGRAMLLGDWRAVNAASSSAAAELDEPVAALMAAPDEAQQQSRQRATAVLGAAQRVIDTIARQHRDMHTALIEVERAAYAAGAEDVRIKASRTPDGPPTTLPDEPVGWTWPARIVIAVRCGGEWARAETRLAA